MRAGPSFLALVVLAGCPLSPSPQAPARAVAAAPLATSSTAAAAPVDPLAEVRPGQVYSYKVIAGSREDTVVEVGKDSVTVDRVLKLGDQQQKRRATDSLEPDLPPLPPGASWEKKGTARLVVSGRAFDCEVRTSPDGNTRAWVAKAYPFVVKLHQNGFTTVELVEVAEIH